MEFIFNKAFDQLWEKVRKKITIPDSNKRFSEFIKMVKDYIPPSNIAKAMKLESEQALISVAKGEEPLTFDQAKALKKKFGVKQKWLLDGIGAPFPLKSSFMYPYEVLSHLKTKKDYTIYFVRSFDISGRTGIVIKYGDYKYEVMDQVWHISGEIGNTGYEQLLSMHKLIKEIKEKKSDWAISALSIMLDEDRFSQLFKGELYPAIVSHQNYSHWMIDFYYLKIPENSNPNYGHGFQTALNILRRK